MRYGLIFLLISFLVLNILDAHSTYLFVGKLGIEAEGNPTGRWVMEHFGMGLAQLVFARIFLSFVPLLVIGIYLASVKKFFKTDDGYVTASQLLFIGILIFGNIIWAEAVIGNYQLVARLN